MPNWLLNPGAVLLRKFVRNRGDPLCDKVELIEANPSFARICHSNGIETTVSTKDLAKDLAKKLKIHANFALLQLKIKNNHFIARRANAS